MADVGPSLEVDMAESSSATLSHYSHDRSAFGEDPTQAVEDILGSEDDSNPAGLQVATNPPIEPSELAIPSFSLPFQRIRRFLYRR